MGRRRAANEESGCIWRQNRPQGCRARRDSPRGAAARGRRPEGVWLPAARARGMAAARPRAARGAAAGCWRGAAPRFCARGTPPSEAGCAAIAARARAVYCACTIHHPLAVCAAPRVLFPDVCFLLLRQTHSAKDLSERYGALRRVVDRGARDAERGGGDVRVGAHERVLRGQVLRAGAGCSRASIQVKQLASPKLYFEELEAVARLPLRLPFRSLFFLTAPQPNATYPPCRTARART